MRFATIVALPPIGRQNLNSPLVLTYIQDRELDRPAGGRPINRKLVTHLPEADLAEVVEKPDR